MLPLGLVVDKNGNTLNQQSEQILAFFGMEEAKIAFKDEVIR